MYQLVSHSDTPSLHVSKVTAQVCTGADQEIWVEYMIFPTQSVVFPETRPANRADGLWKTTCFEIFLMPDEGFRYFEYNLSPSSEWAAYAFDSYRSGMQNHTMTFEPEIEPTETYSRDTYWLAADLPLPEPQTSSFRMGLSAVIEEKDGHKSYWALAHPDGPPDFHDPSCFTARLPE